MSESAFELYLFSEVREGVREISFGEKCREEGLYQAVEQSEVQLLMLKHVEQAAGRKDREGRWERREKGGG